MQCITKPHHDQFIIKVLLWKTFGMFMLLSAYNADWLYSEMQATVWIVSLQQNSNDFWKHDYRKCPFRMRSNATDPIPAGRINRYFVTNAIPRAVIIGI